jgi:hypothetical protein
MGRSRRFTWITGKDVEADSAVSFFEALRTTETVPTPDLARFLDLIRSRGALGFGVDLDVGVPGTDVATRCRRALASLILHGWVRISARGVQTGGPVGQRLAAAG